MKFKVVRMCKDEAVSIVPQQIVKFDLEKAAAILRDRGYKVEDTAGLMVTATKEGFSITLYRSGRMLLHPSVDKVKAQKMATDFFAIVEDALIKLKP